MKKLLAAYQKFWWTYPGVNSILLSLSFVLTFASPLLIVDVYENGFNFVSFSLLFIWAYGGISYFLVNAAEKQNSGNSRN